MEHDSASVKLSDIVMQFFKENDLPFCLKKNTIDPRIHSIRKTEWGPDFVVGAINEIGFVSDRRGMVHIEGPEHGFTWLNPKDPHFFEALDARLRLYI